MRRAHFVLSCLALALAAFGCNIASRTVIAEFPGPAAMNVAGTMQGSTAIGRVDVDLNQVAVYRNTKSGLQSVVDMALLGSIKNNGLTFVKSEFYVTADSTAFTSPAIVRGSAVPLWGPIEVVPSGLVALDWNKSAALVGARGRELIARETAGDGRFTIYALGVFTGTSWNFTVQDFRAVLILETDS